MFDKIFNNPESMEYYEANYTDLFRTDYITALINQKLVSNLEHPEKAKVLSELLNEIKLAFSEPANREEI